MSLNWLRGFQRLGHDVWYVEDDSVWPYDPMDNTVTDNCSYAVSHVARCTERIGLKGRWAFRLVVGTCISGVSQPYGGQRGHTCGDSGGTRAEAVMSKIES